MKMTYWLLAALLLVVVGKAVFIWSGAYNIAADEPHWPLTERLMETLRDRSIAARASDIAVPDLDDELLIRAGAGNYDAMCTSCHLKPGADATELAKGLYPAPPDLRQKRNADPAAAFWVIKHGIKMSGMPAWGRSMDDEYIWGMVAFIRQMPGMPRERYEALVSESGGHEHGDGESGPQETQEDAAAVDHSKAPPHSH